MATAVCMDIHWNLKSCFSPLDKEGTYILYRERFVRSLEVKDVLESYILLLGHLFITRRLFLLCPLSEVTFIGCSTV